MSDERNTFEICTRPVFIIGSPRSGTSILAWSLAQHTRLWTSAESDFLFHLFGKDRFEEALETTLARPDGSWLTKNGVERKELLESLGLGVNALFTSRSVGRRWIDQSPTYTLIADLLAEMFPGASFLHILRDGRQVVASMVSSGFDTHWAGSFAEACRAWSHYVDVAARFCKARPSRCRTIRLAALAADPSRVFREVLDFLGLAYEDAPAAFFAANRINSSRPEAAPGDGEAVWRSWTPEQQRIFNERASATLLRQEIATEHELAILAPS